MFYFYGYGDVRAQHTFPVRIMEQAHHDSVHEIYSLAKNGSATINHRKVYRYKSIENKEEKQENEIT